MIKEYDRRASVKYAQKWAKGRNPNYYDFSKIGGDCTNFISQCLLAGGGEMNFDKYYGWYYNNEKNRSPSWTGVRYLQRFLLSNHKKGPFGKVVLLNHLKEGDLILLKRPFQPYFTHAVIVTKIAKQQIFVCSHTQDALDKPLQEFVFDRAMGIQIEGIKV